jgi:hypothetical protein
MLNTYGGVGPKYCYTAFVGIALEYTVEYAVVAFCLAELKGGATILRACTFVLISALSNSFDKYRAYCSAGPLRPVPLAENSLF